MESIKELILNLLEKTGINGTIINLFINLFMVVIWILIGIISSFIVKQILFKMFKIKERGPRAITIGKLISSVSKYVIWFIISIMILSELSIDITPFIASAGVIGLALGFGAQTVVKDFLNGFFIIVEQEFNVGDVVEIGGFKGVVKELGLRTTVLRNWLGEEKIVNNGDISSLINYSIGENMAVVDFGVDYKTDLSKFTGQMTEFIDSIANKYDVITERPVFLGITKLDDSSINMRIIAKTKTFMHIQVERDLRTDLVIFLSKNGIVIPFPQIVVHNE